MLEAQLLCLRILICLIITTLQVACTLPTYYRRRIQGLRSWNYCLLQSTGRPNFIVARSLVLQYFLLRSTWPLFPKKATLRNNHATLDTPSAWSLVQHQHGQGLRHITWMWTWFRRKTNDGLALTLQRNPELLSDTLPWYNMGVVRR